MRYEDASGTFQASGPVANDDADTLAAGSRGPATGNLITGEGTQYGASGADSAAGAHVAAIAGHGGEDSSFAGGKLSVAGQFGNLTVDAEGNYSYLANKGAPENVRDRFTYTLADNQGNTDTAALIVEIGKTPAVIKADAQQVIVGPDGVVTLPPGVELSDIMVVGRNLVVNMPDGTQLVIVDGAVFVPQLVLGGVEVPATNVAALLVGQEVQPAAGETPPSSGGNFALPPPPLDPGVPLGDLLPPTELDYIPPEPQEVFDILDEEPEIFVQPDGQPAQVNAVDQVEEAGLPGPRLSGASEPPGSGEGADGNGTDNDVGSETTGGTILINSPDGIASLTITGANGVAQPIVVGLVVQGQFGALTITGIVGDDFTYSYTLRDNTSGNDTHDDFSVVLTDSDGDVAAATLRIDIIDDVPTARPDTDSIAAGQFGPATGNVMTDAAAGDAGDSDTNAADTVGADNASVTSVSSVNVPANSDNTFSGGVLQVAGQYGVLTIEADGDYSYTRNPNTPGGVTETFNYTITDGDGDTSTTTLTITIGDLPITIVPNAVVKTDDDAVPGEGGNPGGNGDDVDAENLTGTLSGSGGDGTLTFDLLTTGAPAGCTYVDGPGGSILVQQVQNGSPVTVLTITVNATTGAYTVTQNAPILHPTLNGQAGDDTENNVSFTINYTVSDLDGDTANGTLVIDVDDDTPVATQTLLTEVVDEDGLAGGNPGGVNDVAGEDVIGSGSVASLFSAGADNPLTFSLLSDTSGLPQNLTSNGAAVTYSVSGNTLTASANGSPVFTFVLNADGTYTFTLLDQLDHPSLDGVVGEDDTENSVDLEIPLGSIIQATDTDGDSVTAGARGLVITVDDDSPEPFEECPDDVIVVNEVGETFTGNLNLPPVGADQPGIVSFVVNDGDPVLDNEGNPVTSEGVELFYFVNDDGVLEARAGGETGDVIFTITLNDNGTFTYEQLGEFGEGSEFSFNDLTSSAAGNVEFRGVGADDPATTVDLLLSAGPGDGVTVNTDSDSIGSANQSMDNGETVRIDLVSNLTTGGGTPSGFSYGAHVSSSSFIGLIPQVQGSQDQTTAFTVWALNSSNTQASEPDRDPAGGFSDASITAVTAVTVKDYLTGDTTTVDVTGFTVGVFTAVDFGISVRVNADGSVTFSGIQQGDSYGFTTGGGEFNAIVVRSEPAGTGGSTQDSYDLGIFSIGVANEFEPFGLEVPIALTDSDGDAVVCDIDISVGVPLDAPDITVTVNEAGLPLIGSDAASNSEIDSGNLQTLMTGGTGPYTFVLVGSGNGAFGNLVLNPDGTFTYTLDTVFDSQPDANDGTNPELGAEVFTFEATDSLGAKQTGTITVNIIDDVPSVDVTVGNEAAILLTTQDADTIGVATDQDATAINFGGAFGIATVPGADGQQSLNTSYTLGVVSSASGLFSNGNEINLYDVGGVIVGSTAGAPPASLADASIVFTISVSNTGVVTLQQMQQIDHPIAGDPDATDAPFDDHLIALADGKVSLARTSTITDNDGDVDSDSAVIDLGGNIRFADHGPDANNDVDALASGNVGIADGNVLTGVGGSDTFGPDGVADFVGADAPGRISAITFGATTLAIAPGGSQVINGLYGQLTIFSNGNYSYDRFDDSPGGVSDIFTYTLIDFDGDTDQATLTINIGVNPPVATGAAAAVDDDGLSGANAANPNDINANTFPAIDDLDGAGSSEATFRGQLGVTGGDGDIDFNLIAPAGQVAVGQEMVTFSYVGGLLTATIADSPIASREGATLFTVSLNEESGEYVLTLVDNVLHGDDANNDEDGFDVQVLINYQVTDASLNNSALPGVLTLTFNDDVPTANSEVDSVAAGTNGPATGNVITASEIGVPDDANGTDGVADVSGADGASVTFIDNTLNGAPGVAVPAGGSVVVAGQFGNLTIFANGDYSYARTPGEGGGETEIFQYTLTDADGDESLATLTINIGNLTPVAGTSNAKLDDDGLGGANTGVGTDDINANDGSETGAGIGNEAIYTGTLAVTGGDGDIDFSLIIPGGSLAIGQETVTFSGSAGSLTATIATSPDASRVGDTLFTITLDTETGAYTLTLVDNVLHNADNNENEDGTEVSINLPFQVVDQDNDASAANGTLNIVFNDDVPDLTAVLSGTQLRIDETDGVVAAGGEVDPAGGNLGAVTKAIADIVSLTALFGADGAAAGAGSGFSYALTLSAAGVDSGFDYSSTNANILLFDAGTVGGIQTIEGRVGGVGGPVAFSIAVNTTTGSVTMTQFLAVEHSDTASKDEVSPAGIAAGALTLVINATDADGDTDSASVDLGSIVRFEDDGPRMVAASNINIQNSGDVAHTGTFDFEIGSDSPNPSNDDIKNVTMTLNINGTNIVPTTFVAGAETATTATYTFTFSYSTGSGTANNSGTLTFDKVAGTYTVDLANPIQPFVVINSTSGATAFLGYDEGTTNQTNSQPDVVNVQLRADNPGTPGNEALWVRLTGIDEPGSGTGADNLSTTSGNLAWTAGELITGAQSWVSASNTANGVAGDIVNEGQVLNLDLFTANQFGNSTSTATASAESIYFKLDNIGNQEDFIVILKLWSDTNGNGTVDVGETTTRAVYVANGDMIKGGGGVTAGPGQYSGVSLDNNDALVIIESNDYNFGGETYKIIGAQIAVSDEGITGTAIDLNGAINAASTNNADNISDDGNDLGFKIQDIGFVSTASTAQPATMTFDVTVGDADGDTVTQTITATVTAAADSSTPIVLDPSVTTALAAPLSTNNSLVQEEQLQKTAANSNTLTMAAAVAASGLADSVAAEPTYDPAVMRTADVTEVSYSNESVEKLSADGGESGSLAADLPEASDAESAAGNSAGRGNANAKGSDNQLDAGSSQASSDDGASHQAANDQGPAAAESQVALPPSVAMASAEQLEAAGLDDNAQKGGEVEKIVAEALAGGDAPTVDGLLAYLAEGLGDVPGLAHVASQDAGHVPGWDMASDGGSAGNYEMLMKVGAELAHHDAIQPAVNG